MKKIHLKLGKEMLSKEQMKKVTGGNSYNYDQCIIWGNCDAFCNETPCDSGGYVWECYNYHCYGAKRLVCSSGNPWGQEDNLACARIDV